MIVFRLALFVAALFMSGSALYAATVHVRLRAVNQGQSFRAVLVAEASDASLPGLRAEVDIPSEVRIELSEAPAWTLSLQGDGLWAASQTVLGTHAELITIDAFAAGVVEFRPKVPPGVASRAFRARFQTVGQKIAGMTDCTMRKQMVSCPVVALPVDLRLSTDGLAPHYAWSLSVAPGTARNLGEVTFEAGASLSGYVRYPSAGQSGLGRVVIELEPESRAKLTEADEDRTALVSMQARPTKNGFFQFRGVRPGGYRLTAISGTRRSPAVNVTIHPDIEAQLKAPLVLQEPFSLNVIVVPPVDPWNKPWVVTLERHSGTPNQVDPVTTGAALPMGSWSASGLTAGRYAVKVGRETPGTWLNREIDLDHETQLVLSMDLVKVVGKVLLGERPLTGAWVWFGGEDGGIAVPVLVRENGEFRVQLPRQENHVWKRVEVIAEQPNVRAILEDVRVEPVGDGDIARVTLQVSDRGLHGQVVDARGEPVMQPVTVNVTRPDSDVFLQILTGKQGEFSLHGVETGTIQLRAVTKGAESAPLVMTIEEQQKEAPFVELRLQSKRTVRGVIRSRFGAIAGARITAIPDQRATNLSYPLTSDFEGKFEAHLNAASAVLTLSVAAPGYAYRFFRTGAPDDPLVVDVDHVGGHLVFEFASDLEKSGMVPVFFHGGAYDGLRALAFRAGEDAEHTEELTRIAIPLAEPGEYTACWKSRDEWLALIEGKLPAKPEGRCAAGFLAPFSELRLRLP